MTGLFMEGILRTFRGRKTVLHEKGTGGKGGSVSWTVFSEAEFSEAVFSASSCAVWLRAVSVWSGSGKRVSGAVAAEAAGTVSADLSEKSGLGENRQRTAVRQ